MATATMSPTTDFIAREDAWGAHNYHPLDLVIAEAKGAWVTDVEGNRYLDCLSAYSAVNQGHCHPRLLRTLVEQASRVTLTSRAFRNDQLGGFCEDLAQLCGMEMVLPMNTGAEAVETAIKAARRWGYRTKGIPDGQAQIIAFENNFHGRTTTIVGFSSEPAYRAQFGPFAPGFVLVPFGDLDAVRRAMNANTCAVLIEPIQCEAGVLMPPDGFLPALSALCAEQQVLLMADEIQTGLGRTGTLFACDHEGVTPDVYILGKALSGGFYPVSAVVSRREVLEVFGPGSHGSTFGGNPLGCAVAREAMRVLHDEALVERSATEGAWLLEQLRTLRHPAIKAVRGRGLMCAIELHEAARPYCEALQTRGVLCKETHSTVIRLSPPLVVAHDDLVWAVEQLRAVFDEQDR
ncbi:ornithine--oxo-acid transaminase [Gemmatimonas phototrophica]|uniref:ornithine aminotransferase n=1 Tax=Gemmatimonas phototrophica TaxID=1379270 RepID=A0A143BNB6_9BACT|nr:ornithine--oxo-acid transaminase [Gemmatimonas phototrophica]AMW05951.1 ornithine--oxo-acid aminotransferase [Gemmatimonas phototrophica]